MSIRLPGRAKAGRLAVTMTAATFLVASLASLSRVLTPSRSSMPISVCRVKIEVAQPVAGAVQPDHQAIADQLVVADALDIGDVLDPDRLAPAAGPRPARTAGQRHMAASAKALFALAKAIFGHAALRPADGAGDCTRRARLSGREAAGFAGRMRPDCRAGGEDRCQEAQDAGHRQGHGGRRRRGRPGAARRAAAGRFRGRPARVGGAGGGAGAAAAGAVGLGLLALQEGGDRAARDQAARRRAELILKELQGLQRDLLHDGPDMNGWNGWPPSKRGRRGPTHLRDAVEAIVLRAEIELARRGWDEFVTNNVKAARISNLRGLTPWLSRARLYGPADFRGAGTEAHAPAGMGSSRQCSLPCRPTTARPTTKNS